MFTQSMGRQFEAAFVLSYTEFGSWLLLRILLFISKSGWQGYVLWATADLWSYWKGWEFGGRVGGVMAHHQVPEYGASLGTSIGVIGVNDGCVNPWSSPILLAQLLEMDLDMTWQESHSLVLRVGGEKQGEGNQEVLTPPIQIKKKNLLPEGRSQMPKDSTFLSFLAIQSNIVKKQNHSFFFNAT